MKAASPALLPRLFAPLNAALEPWLKLGFANPLWTGPGLVVLEVVGRKTGQPRSVPLVAWTFGNLVAVSTVRERSQWVKNLQAAGHGTLWLRGRPRRASLLRLLPAVGSGTASIALLEVR